MVSSVFSKGKGAFEDGRECCVFPFFGGPKHSAVKGYLQLRSECFNFKLGSLNLS